MTYPKILCWLIAPVALFMPLLWIDPMIMWGNSDALFYTNILAFISDSLKSGELYPRWFAAANAGFGSPVMMFYTPLAYLITALIHLPFTALHLKIYTQFIIGIYASQVVSGMTSFLWLRHRFAPRVAFIGSLLFVLLPYKIIYIYLHINLAQLWALAFLPLWMLAAEKLLENNIRWVGLYALAFAATYYCHPLTVIAFGAIPACYVLWFGRKRWPASYGKLALAHLLGIGLCLMQALPQYYYLSWIHVEGFLTGRLAWKNNFFHMDVALCAYYAVIAVIVTYAIQKISALKSKVIEGESLFWLIVLGVTWFMTQHVSNFIWELFPPLQYLQFPAARLHAGALMAVTFFLCVWLQYYKEMLPLGPLVYHRTSIMLLIGAFSVATIHYMYGLDLDPSKSNKQYMGDAAAASIIPVPEYKTRWGCMDAGKAYDLYVAHNVPAIASVISGKAEVKVIDWQPPQRVVLQVNVVSKEATITLRQCYVPLWQALMDGEQEIAVIPGSAQGTATEGLIQFSVPNGVHQVEIAFASTSMQRVGQWISIVCLLLCLLMIPKYRKI